MSICTLNCIGVYSDVSYIFVFIVNLSFSIKIKSTVETSEISYIKYTIFTILHIYNFQVHILAYLKLCRKYLSNIFALLYIHSINLHSINLHRISIQLTCMESHCKETHANITKRLILLTLSLQNILILYESMRRKK